MLYLLCMKFFHERSALSLACTRAVDVMMPAARVPAIDAATPLDRAARAAARREWQQPHPRLHRIGT